MIPALLALQAISLALLAWAYRRLQRRNDELLKLALHAHTRIGDVEDEVDANAEELREMQEWIVGEDEDADAGGVRRMN